MGTRWTQLVTRRRLHIACVLWSSAALALLVAMLTCGRGGNHWLFFGSFLDRLVTQWPTALAAASAVPLFIPVVVERSKASAVLVILGVLYYAAMRLLLFAAAD